MKKIILLAVVAVAVTGASCRKERTCECSNTSTTVTTFGSNSTTTTNTSSSKYTASSQKKSFFRNAWGCYSTKSTETNNFTGGSSVTTTDKTCEVK
jgi:hypothetical protein